MEIKFGNHVIGPNHPTYFIADIAANHDGDIERAKQLIRLAKEAGADAAKMVAETRLLERSLGSPDKFIADNELETQIVQRRRLRAARDIQAGEAFTREMIDVLRPATVGAIKPGQIENVIGTKALHDFKYGQELRWTALGD